MGPSSFHSYWVTSDASGQAFRRKRRRMKEVPGSEGAVINVEEPESHKALLPRAPDTWSPRTSPGLPSLCSLVS